MLKPAAKANSAAETALFPRLNLPGAVYYRAEQWDLT
jgi:hypothetical protein